MSDPLKTNSLHTVMVNETAMKFCKVYSPKMKSVYWKHFGFPTNESGHIITKQNVVCVLCHKVLTNHGNTTNLRAHLQHRHKEIFHKMCKENDIKIPPRKPHPRQVLIVPKNEIMQQKIKLEFESHEQSDEASINNEDHSMLYESMVPLTYDDDTEPFTKREISATCSNFNSNSIVTKGVTADCLDSTDEVCGPSEVKNSNFRLDVLGMEPYQIQDALVNIIVKDLWNVSALYGEGMSQFLRLFGPNAQIPIENKMRSIIQELHSDKLTTMSDQIKVHSQVKTYSLGFELWTNIENKIFLSIFYNYTTDIPEFRLHNQLYCTIEYNKYTSTEAIFNEFNLVNCSVAIVNYDDDDYLKGFLRNKRIPVILSYPAIVDKCLQNVFALPSVASSIEEVKEIVARYTSEITSKAVDIPMVNSDFPWTYYELLKFFSEMVSWPEDVDSLVASAKTITDTISPLAVTLETLKGEDIPQISMITPISTKILNKKIVISDSDDEFVTSIKTAISSELHKYALSDDHLTISALLDPRFHRLIDVPNIKRCIDILNEKYSKFAEWNGYSPKKAKSEKDIAASSKKSSLELFFDITETTAGSSVANDTSVEDDLKRYRKEVYVTLDESPSLWWGKVGHMYGGLKQLAMIYQCVPCVVNMNFKKNIKEQLAEHFRRFMLTGALVDAILFLHQHTK